VQCKKSIFEEIFAGWGRLEGGSGVVNVVVLAGVLSTTSKKRSSTFFAKKVHPRENPGYSYVCKHKHPVIQIAFVVD